MAPRRARAFALLGAALLLALAPRHVQSGDLEDHPLFDMEEETPRLLAYVASLKNPPPRSGPVQTPNATCAAFEAAIPGGFEGALRRFQLAVQIPTVTQAAYKGTFHAVDINQHRRFIKFVKDQFLELDGVNDPNLTFEQTGGGQLSMLITWRGSNPSLLPAVFYGHYDVVPTDYERANSTWEHGVFSGHVDRARDRIYGRGTADDKGHCMAMLEAARALRRVRWQPARTLVFLLGHDEEASGTFGANQTLHQVLKQRYPNGVEYMIDEGVGMLENIRSKKVTALLSVAEKGQQFINLTVNAAGGHTSSTPNDGSAMGDILGRMFTAITNKPLPDQVPLYIQQMVSEAMPLFSTADQAKIRGMGGPLEQADAIVNLILGTAAASTLDPKKIPPFYQQWVRSKRAMAILATGTSENTLPQVARMSWNFRTLWPWKRQGDAATPGMERYFTAALQRMADPLLHRVGDTILRPNTPASYNVTFAPTNRAYGVPPMLGTDINSQHYQTYKQVLQSTLTQDGKPIDVIPGLMVGSTDQRHLAPLARQGALRCYPYVLTVEDARRIHGDNEQLSISSWRSGLCVMHQLIRAYGSA